jgi:transcriptional regulator with XRE-family HTH domain
MALSERIKQQGWTQAEAATHLGVTQPRVSDLVRGKINLFAIDALVSMATTAGLKVEIGVKAAARKQKTPPDRSGGAFCHIQPMPTSPRP